MKIEFGVGMKPTPGYTHHDLWKHSDHVDVAFPLNVFPWPYADGTFDEILAVDVFEHLLHPDGRIIRVQEWLDECYRILTSKGTLNMRLPLFTNAYSHRDPTHYRIFHMESFNYWCPDAPGTVWEMFGQYYFGEGYNKWWNLVSRTEEHKDLRIILQKR